MNNAVKPITDKDRTMLTGWSDSSLSKSRPVGDNNPIYLLQTWTAQFFKAYETRLSIVEQENKKLRKALEHADNHIEPVVKKLCDISKYPHDVLNVMAIKLGNAGDHVRSVLQRD